MLHLTQLQALRPSSPSADPPDPVQPVVCTEIFGPIQLGERDSHRLDPLYRLDHVFVTYAIYMGSGSDSLLTYVGVTESSVLLYTARPGL